MQDDLGNIVGMNIPIFTIDEIDLCSFRIIVRDQERYKIYDTSMWRTLSTSLMVDVEHGINTIVRFTFDVRLFEEYLFNKM